MAEAFFARLPPSKLTASETELRDCLLKAVAVAKRVLPGAGTVTLQEWVDRRIPGQVVLATTEDGWITLASGEAPAAERRGGLPAADQAAEALKPARPQFPVKPVAKASSVAPAGGSTAAAEAFFSRLPQDSFTQTEEALRSALKALLAERGPLPVSQAAADPSVASAAKATLIRAVALADWVERRIGGEVQVVLDERGGRILQLARHEKEARIEAFFGELPEGRFSREEDALRSAIIDFLAGWKSKELATLSHAGSDKRIQRAKADLFGENNPVTMREWIERRIGGELELQKDAKGQYVIHVTEASKSVVHARFQELEWAARGGKDKGFEAKGAIKGAASFPAGFAQVKGGAKGISNEKGKGAAKPAIASEATEEDAIALEEKKEAEFAAREEKREAFFAALPEDGFTQEEQLLREALLHYVDSTRDHRPSLSGAGSDPQVRDSRGGVVPKGCGASLREWIDRRIGGEIETFEVGREVCIARRKSAEKREKVDKTSLLEAFFDALPADGFTPEEEAMREALLNFIQNFKGADGVPPTLSNAGSDAQVREARVALIPKNAGVSLKDWIDQRIGLEVETITEEHNMIYIGLRGELEAKVRALPKQVVKRKAPDDKGKGSKAAKGGGKGKDDRAIIGAPVKRQRL